jgi:hypothetical protein
VSRALPSKKRGHRSLEPCGASGLGGVAGSVEVGRGAALSQPGDAASLPFRPGDPFNPYRMFTGLFIPEGLACLLLDKPWCETGVGPVGPLRWLRRPVLPHGEDSER